MHGRDRNPFDRFLFSLLMATPCLAVGFAMTLAREAGSAADPGWWGALLATVGMVVAAACSDALHWEDREGRSWRDWKFSMPWKSRKFLLAGAGLLALVIGLLMLAWSGAWCTCAFVAFGAGAGVVWSVVPRRHPLPINAGDGDAPSLARLRERLRKDGVRTAIRSLPANFADLWRHPRSKRRVIWFFVIFAFSSYGLVGLSFEPVAPLELTLWFALLLPLMIASAFARKYWRFPFLAVLVALAFVFSYYDLNDIHTVRHRVAPKGAPAVLPAADAFRAWLDKREKWDKDGPRPVFLVAAEGGGIRAAYWTALVLEELRARNPGFPGHTFLIAGVSGGSVGAASYAAALALGIEEAPAEPGAEPYARRAKSVLALHADLLSPVLRGLFFELPTRALPAFITTWLADLVGGHLDRSTRLETAFEDAWQRATGHSIGDLYVQGFRDKPAERNVPNLLLLTTSVETGHRMAVGHLAMRREGAPKEAASPCRIPSQDEEPETAARLWNLVEAPGVDLPLSTAAMLSARFTLLTPAGTLPCGSGPRRRFVDGGYFENSGVTTLLDVIAEVRETAASRGVRLVVIRIENSRATTNPASRKDSPSEPLYSGFAELWSPVRAMMGTRRARGELAVTSLGRVIKRAGEECGEAEKAKAAGSPAKPCLPVKQVVFDLRPGNVHIPLGWWLTDGARRDMERQLRDSSKTLDCVHDLLAGKTGENCNPE